MSILSRKIRSVDPRKIRPIMTNFGTNSNGEILEFLNACPSKTWILEFTAGLMSEDETFLNTQHNFTYDNERILKFIHYNHCVSDPYGKFRVYMDWIHNCYSIFRCNLNHWFLVDIQHGRHCYPSIKDNLVKSWV